MFDPNDIFPEKNYSYEEAVSKFAPGKFTAVNGSRMHYLEKGNGKPLVLIHGFLNHSFMWHQSIDLLADHFRVYAVDLCGFGYSARKSIDQETLFEEYEAQIIGFADNMGLERFSVMAHSVGGGLALYAAAKNPRRVGRMLLVCPYVLSYEIKTEWNIFELLTINNDFLACKPENEPVKMILMAYLFSNQKSVSQSYARELLLPLCIDDSYLSLKLGLDFGLKPRFLDDEAEKLAALKMPIMVIHGAEDKAVPLAASKKFVEMSSSFKLETLEKSGHNPHLDFPDRLNKLAIDFLLS